LSNILIMAALAVLLMVVVLLKHKLAGRGGRPPIEPDTSWERLAAQYGADELTGKEVFEKIGGKVGRGYAGVGGDDRGLILWHPGHRGARIPWGDLMLIPGSYMDLPAFRIETVKTADITIVIPRRYEELLRERAGALWPGVSNRTAPDEPGAEE
jgi:hypothetical protein